MGLNDAQYGALAGILSNLAISTSEATCNGAGVDPVTLPGDDTIEKTTLERELTNLAARIGALESQATSANGDIPVRRLSRTGKPPSDSPRRKSQHSRNLSGSNSTKTTTSIDNSDVNDEHKFGAATLEVHQSQTLLDHIQQQEIKIKKLQELTQDMKTDMQGQGQQRLKENQESIQLVEKLKRELDKSKQANTAFQKALREIGNIVTAVADGDLNKKVLVHTKEMDPEITTFKKTINRMVDQLQDFATQVTFIAKEVGTEGRLGGQANLPGVTGIWADLTNNVNIMAENLTEQVREIAVVTTAVAHGDLSRKIERPAKGEILELQRTINVMVDQLRTFATEVTRVARDVGTEGALGGQAKVEGVQGMWNDLTINVNAMADNLTTQVRDIAKVTTAVARGDLTQKVSATCKGEILDLKSTINSMVDQLQQFAHEVTNLAQEVGTEGRLGGQATVHGVDGTWRDLTHNVNVMAMKLTTQVREIAEVTTAVAQGDLSRKVTADVKGEILALKVTINNMVDRLSTFAFEVSKVAREVGTEGTLGGQAKVAHVEGKWKDLTDNVNTMAEVSRLSARESGATLTETQQNLTSQVRSISEVTQAIAGGDMSRKIHVDAQGEILVLKDTINDMVDRLDNWSLAVKRVARDVGVDGKMGGQARVEGIEGRWKEITVDVNIMAQNLTSQLRAFADITNAANSGDFTQEITIAASGEMDELKRKINKMVSGLRESIEKNTKAREVAELANKTKSEFLANMSHEIRTPMNGIIGMTQLSLDSELTSYQREMLSTVHQLANSLLTIIDDILDISKIEANRMDIEKIPFPVRSTVFNALKSLSVKANERGLNLAYEVDSATLDYVVGDSFRLRQIVLNLVGNAIKFTERGEVRVRILEADQINCAPNEYNIMFSVSDTGIGIPEDKLEVIFDTFQQADGSTTRRFGGTGLGLSISRKLVGLMGGQLWVKSGVGKGSEFCFTCKYLRADPDVAQISESLYNYGGHTVLFVDQGHTGCAEQICESITQLNLVPLVCRNEDDTLPEIPSANGHTYDCIIVDNNETARNLRQIEKFKYIPIILVAPQVSVNFRTALEDGITSYMTTPCLAIDLGNALIPALESRATLSKDDHSKAFNILLAEDNLVNQKLAVRILEKYKHNVTVANNGFEAYEFVTSKDFDVVLMDVQMPVMGGFEATQKIREWERVNKVTRTPILALTAHAMLGDREKCLQAEMDDYLSKPLKQAHLIQCIIKYATMSGAMQDRKQHRARRSMHLGKDKDKDGASKSPDPNLGDGLLQPSAALKRPGLGSRGFTESARGMESPAIVSDEQGNPFDRVSLEHPAF